MPLSRLSISAELARSPSTLSRPEVLALVAYLSDIPVRTDWTAHQLCSLLELRWEYVRDHPPTPSPLLAWIRRNGIFGRG